MIWSVINLPAVKSGVISVRVPQTRFHFCWLSSFSRCCFPRCCFGPEPLQAILPPSLHHVAATRTAALLLKKLSRGEDDDSYNL